MRKKAKTKEVAAILVSDLHLQSTPPPARADEPDWYDAMKRPLAELSHLANYYDAPILCAGDVFDRWNASSELVNFAIDHLPQMYAIPGQHDLAYHRLADLHRTAFGTLTRARVLRLPRGLPSQSVKLDRTMVVHTRNTRIWLHFFPWGREVEPNRLTDRCRDDLHVALIHHYIWKHTYGHPHAARLDNVNYWGARLDGYDVAVFGDNHQGFSATVGDCLIWNNGTFMRRASNDDPKPRVGLLHPDGSITPHYLDTSKDVFTPTAKEPGVLEDAEFSIEEFMRDLQKLGRSKLDFHEAMKRYVRSYEVTDGAKQILKEILGEPEHLA